MYRVKYLFLMLVFGMTGGLFTLWLGTTAPSDFDSAAAYAKVIYSSFLLAVGFAAGLGVFACLFFPEEIEKHLKARKKMGVGKR